MIFWTFTLVVSAVILYLMGYVTGYIRAMNEEDEHQQMKEKAEQASKRGELL